MKTKIRMALLSDLDQITQINLASWQHVCIGRVDQLFIEAFTFDQCLHSWHKRLNDLAENSQMIFVADVDGIVGFSYLGPNEDPDLLTYGQIYLIYLKPSAIGTGIGKALMQTSLNALYSMGYLQASLWVLDLNEHAKNFYVRQGFSPDGSRDLDERTGTSRLRYRCNITDSIINKQNA